MTRFYCCEVCDRNPSCGVGCGSCEPKGCDSAYRGMRCVFVEGHDAYHMGGGLTWLDDDLCSPHPRTEKER
jgi:hypothetical protein